MPNLVTWLRIILIPLIVGIFYLPDAWLSPVAKNIAATAIFVIAALSDSLDGYLARVLDQASAFGAFLDPVADKLIEVAALVCVAGIVLFALSYSVRRTPRTAPQPAAKAPQTPAGPGAGPQGPGAPPTGPGGPAGPGGPGRLEALADQGRTLVVVGGSSTVPLHLQRPRDWNLERGHLSP